MSQPYAEALQNPANVYELTPQAREELVAIETQLPPPDRFTGPELDRGIVEEYRRALDEIPDIQLLRQRMGEDLDTRRDARGYLIIDGVPMGQRGDMTIPTAMYSLAGWPFWMVKAMGFWQRLGVKLDAVPYRFQGVGENPMHIDTVNTTKPADYFCFYGVRTDPAGGGESILSNVQDMVDQLTPAEVDQLSQPIFREGQFHGMQGVGEELNPFPVLERRPDGLWTVRYTGKMLPDMSDSPIRRLLVKVGGLLYGNREAFTLQPGQMLIANQTIMAHGREPLGPNQERIPDDQRRLIWQSYLHYDATVMTP